MERTIFPAGDGAHPIVVQLSPSAMRRKALMLDCFGTQRSAVQAFASPIEGFRKAAARDFTRSPYPGQLGFERTHSGLEGALWRELMACYSGGDRGIAPHGFRFHMLRALLHLLIASADARRRYSGKAEWIERILARLVFPDPS